MRIFGSLCLALALTACTPPDAPSAGTDASSDGAPPAAPATDRTDESARPVVVFFGTSLTAGLGLPSEDDTYVARATELAREAGVPITPVNAGVSGETSAAGLRRIDWILQRPLDVLVLELGANDGLRGLPIGQLRENLIEIIRRTREHHPEAEVVLLAMEAPPNLGERYTEAFRQVFPDVAEQEGALLVPFILDGIAGIPEMNQADRIHPTAQGHRRMAENLMPAFLKAVESAYARIGVTRP
jgi:acyl-CoA thioesterase I